MPDGPGRRKELTKQPIRDYRGSPEVLRDGHRGLDQAHGLPPQPRGGRHWAHDRERHRPDHPNAMNNREIAMRVSSGVKSGDVFLQI